MFSSYYQSIVITVSSITAKRNISSIGNAYIDADINIIYIIIYNNIIHKHIEIFNNGSLVVYTNTDKAGKELSIHAHNRYVMMFCMP